MNLINTYHKYFSEQKQTERDNVVKNSFTPCKRASSCLAGRPTRRHTPPAGVKQLVFAPLQFWEGIKVLLSMCRNQCLV